MRTSNPWVMDTLLLAMPERGFVTMPEILKRTSPFGVKPESAKCVLWKMWRRYRWIEREVLPDAAISGRRMDGTSKPGLYGRWAGPVYRCRLTRAGRAERAAVVEFMETEFLALDAPK